MHYGNKLPMTNMHYNKYVCWHEYDHRRCIYSNKVLSGPEKTLWKSTKRKSCPAVEYSLSLVTQCLRQSYSEWDSTSNLQENLNIV